MIHVNRLNKKFKNGKGIFDVSFRVSEGEVFGFIGPNGAGKSTTLRHLMGFLKPQSGSAEIAGMNCWQKAKEIKEYVGYLPGEIVFPAGMSAKGFIKLQESMRLSNKKSRAAQLIERFELNVNIPIKKMSKGMKQKLAIIVTFLSDPQIIILDEPSTGLDPIMQRNFNELLLEEKKRGKTILLSSHIFSEVEQVADTICIIKEGRIVKNQAYDEVRKSMKPVLQIRFKNSDDIKKMSIPFIKEEKNCVDFAMDGDVNTLIKEIAKYDIQSLSVREGSLVDLFEDYYKGSDI